MSGGYVNGSGETYTIFLHNKGTSVLPVTPKFVLVIYLMYD